VSTPDSIWRVSGLELLVRHWRDHSLRFPKLRMLSRTSGLQPKQTQLRATAKAGDAVRYAPPAGRCTSAADSLSPQIRPRRSLRRSDHTADQQVSDHRYWLCYSGKSCAVGWRKWLSRSVHAVAMAFPRAKYPTGCEGSCSGCSKVGAHGYRQRTPLLEKLELRRSLLRMRQSSRARS